MPPEQKVVRAGVDMFELPNRLGNVRQPHPPTVFPYDGAYRPQDAVTRHTVLKACHPTVRGRRRSGI